MTPGIFAEALTCAREAAGLSQTQLAKSASLSLSSLNRWENPGSLPRRENAETLDRILGCGGSLLARHQEAKDGFTLPPWARSLSHIEAEARAAEAVIPNMVPGYLQSPSLASLLFTTARPWMSEEETAELTALRCGRLHQLPHLRVKAAFPMFVLDALPEEIRAEQVTVLLKWIETGRVAVHLVPRGSILLTPGSATTVYRFAGDEVAISGDWARGTVLAERGDHGTLLGMVSSAFAAALPAKESVEVLKGLQ
ncbi:Scr1 family TA system antitoxin-like transcriptional regulator [Nocardiopsis sp. N85]|uniref:Scr1 family TA system antitoxin-like transcriptional regulator n=1 Tax=Nocardiopsis sp. N85 TaxID=3029400 RepID=UPI00237FC707|nr:Scr1 family TA system antitoxin-like transcriptional regulator [Nocardiopsis sp. N85]MDE3724615.1 Scr1 family TA system antitoxin-like transcriptional regulator [Nocardiopsis sp. N85]